MTSTLGARLRQHREEQAIPLSAIAQQTKIKVSLLEALERDDLSYWPTGIFRRAYVRAYAAAVGLRPDAVLGEFLDAYPEPVDPADLPPGGTGDGARAYGRMPMRLRDVMGSAMGSLSRFRRAAIANDRSRPVGQPAPAVLPEAAPPEWPPGVLNEEPFAIRSAIELDDVPAPEPAHEPESERATESERAPQLEPQPEPWREPELDLLAAANVCTALGQAENASQVQALLGDASTILGARGLILWVWDDPSAALKPALAHGYPESVLAQLGGVGPDADNLTAAAFRSCQGMAVHGSDHASSALAVPLLTPSACAGVLAIELPNGAEQSGSVWAVATFFAAMLSQLFGGAAHG
jgi:hypothetical protein